MHALDHKIPPAVVMTVLGVGMWALSRVTPELPLPRTFRIAAALIVALAGLGFAEAAHGVFRRARTTVNPLKPDKTSSVVTGGVYRITRNPMYVGGGLVMLGWSVYLANPWTLLGPVLYVAYITRFQIVPEERALSSRFGEPYARYKATVRRWL